MIINYHKLNDKLLSFNPALLLLKIVIIAFAIGLTAPFIMLLIEFIGKYLLNPDISAKAKLGVSVGFLIYSFIYIAAAYAFITLLNFIKNKAVFYSSKGFSALLNLVFPKKGGSEEDKVEKTSIGDAKSNGE